MRSGAAAASGGWWATGLVALLSPLPALLAFASFGLLVTPDSATYLAYAEALRAGPLPVGEALLREGPAPAALFRTPGYPALLAALQALAPAHWPALLVGLQMLALALLAVLAHRTARALGLAPGLALLAALLTATGHAVLAQISVMTDAIHTALAGGAALLLWRAGVRPGGLGPVLIAGVLLGLATLVREATAHLALAYLPAAAIAAGRGAAGFRPARALAGMALVLLPVLLAAGALLAEHQRRAGVAVLSTSRQIVMVQALLPLVARGLPVFDGDDLYDTTARETVGRLGYAGIDPLNARLFAAGMTAPEIAATASDRYARAWRRHPAEMLRAMVVRLPTKMFGVGFMPVDMVAELHRQFGEPRPWFGRPEALWQAARQGSPSAALLLLALLGSRVIGYALAAGAILAPALLAWRGDARAWPALGAWLVIGGYFGMHLPVHLEQRYLLPVVPLVAMLGCLGWVAARRAAPGEARTPSAQAERP
ncbi:hypothetical protein [Falsiroseomonas tokyonensis]|uniref:Glycosyltransferase RgtA/B/C/D-like domain-containing protein n=1 Tax=Falsiroseomonas tokyonensis TaxID=430521 RepID=A0ABV7BZE2_9PROT|nr:hypothetical protein [Falsiroseomonas tokyonensis]MBU8540769.1 hypothetical protein [Falsiroseomonas tokyonensis]